MFGALLIAMLFALVALAVAWAVIGVHGLLLGRCLVSSFGDMSDSPGSGERVPYS
jgi:hypothetical protein